MSKENLKSVVTKIKVSQGITLKKQTVKKDTKPKLKKAVTKIKEA